MYLTSLYIIVELKSEKLYGNFHTNLNNDYQSEELNLLYYADMTVDGQGNWCSYEERIKDIKNRYGENSETLKEVEETVIYLKNKGYDDTFNI